MLLGAGLDGLDDVVVAGAAADIAFELVAHRLFVELLALALHQIDRRHDHAGRAEAALQAMMLAEGFLHRMKLAVLGEAFDRGDLGAVERNGERGAGLDRAAVHMHDAGAALAGVAAHMRAGQTQMLAQEFDQQRAAFDLATHALAIHLQGNCRHSNHPPVRFPHPRPTTGVAPGRFLLRWEMSACLT